MMFRSKGVNSAVRPDNLFRAMLGNATNNRNRALQCCVVLFILGSILVIIRRGHGKPSGVAGWTDHVQEHASPSKTISKNTGSDIQTHALDTELRWDDQRVPSTKIIAHSPGWTIFDRLYVREGAIYVVTDYPELVPDAKEITSKGQKLQAGNVNLEQMEPSADDFKVVTPEEAKLLFGPSSIRISGISVRLRLSR